MGGESKRRRDEIAEAKAERERVESIFDEVEVFLEVANVRARKIMPSGPVEAKANLAWNLVGMAIQRANGIEIADVFEAMMTPEDGDDEDDDDDSDDDEGDPEPEDPPPSRPALSLVQPGAVPDGLGTELDDGADPTAP